MTLLRFAWLLRRNPKAWCLGMLLLAGCKGLTSALEKRSPDEVDQSQMILLRTSDSLAADDSAIASLATLSATIPRDASSRSISFTSSAGAFLENGTKQITIRAIADTADPNKLIATTVLHDTTAEVAIVRAAIADVYDTISIKFPGRK